MVTLLARWLIAAAAVFAVVAGCKSKSESGPSEFARGGEAYLAQCAVCHGIYGGGDGPLAASIAAEGKVPPAVLSATRLGPLGREGVRRAIELGAHRRAGSTMPIWGPHLGEEWMDRIADYVVAMPAAGEMGRAEVARYLATPSGTTQGGRRVYVLYCSGCHGPQGEGDGFFSPSLESGLQIEPLRGSAIATLDDADVLRFIGLGGAHAPKATTMPGWLYTLSPDDRQALAGYLRDLAGSATEK